jgi:hypothetical protein
MRMKFATTSTVPHVLKIGRSPLLPASGAFPEAAACQSCLRGSTRHRVTSPNLLTRQEPAIGRRRSNAAQGA